MRKEKKRTPKKYPQPHYIYYVTPDNPSAPPPKRGPHGFLNEPPNAKRWPVGWRGLRSMADEAGERHRTWFRKKLEKMYEERGIPIDTRRKLMLSSWFEEHDAQDLIRKVSSKEALAEGPNLPRIYTELGLTVEEAMALENQRVIHLTRSRTQRALHGGNIENAIRRVEMRHFQRWLKEKWFKPAKKKWKPK